MFIMAVVYHDVSIKYMHPSNQLQTSQTSEHGGCKQIWSADLEQREMVIEL